MPIRKADLPPMSSTRKELLQRISMIGMGLAGTSTLYGGFYSPTALADETTSLAEIDARLRIIEDLAELKRLRAMYSLYLDGGYDHETHWRASELADLFIEDGLWKSGPIEFHGREEIREGLVGMSGTNYPEFRFAMHMTMNPIIEINGDTATGRYQAIVPIGIEDDDGVVQATWQFGVYNDEYERTAEGWRFKSVVYDSWVYAPYETGWTGLDFFKPASA